MNKTTVYIAGDSTAAQKAADKKPETGWGEKITDYFTEDIAVVNQAVNGRSSKSFIAEGRLALIEKHIKKNDYLFIQFGHNDQKTDPERGTLPYGDYLSNLQTFLETAWQAGAFPVLLTSVSRRAYLADGTLDPQTLGDYPQAMKQLATKKQVPLLDIFTRSQTFLNSLSSAESQQLFLHLAPGSHPNYPQGAADDTHLNETGACAIAQLVAQAISDSQLPLKQGLKGVQP